MQSGSDRILAAMKRGYTVLEYKSIMRRLRAARPDIAISSDFIVGFPGETEQDFEATMKLIDEIGFDNSFSFLYSPRPGTPAAESAPTTRRSKSSSSACNACRRSSNDNAKRYQRRHGRHGATHAGGRAVASEDPQELRAAPKTTAWSISPARMPRA